MHTEERKQIISVEYFKVCCSFCYVIIVLIPSFSCTLHAEDGVNTEAVKFC